MYIMAWRFGKLFRFLSEHMARYPPRPVPLHLFIHTTFLTLNRCRNNRQETQDDFLTLNRCRKNRQVTPFLRRVVLIVELSPFENPKSKIEITPPD